MTRRRQMVRHLREWHGSGELTKYSHALMEAFHDHVHEPDSNAHPSHRKHSHDGESLEVKK